MTSVNTTTSSAGDSTSVGSSTSAGDSARFRARARAGRPTLADVCFDFGRRIHEAGLDFGDEQLDLARTVAVALVTKPFLLFSGLSGAGKTRLAMAMGQWFGRDRLHVESVRPNWITPEGLLGSQILTSDTVDARHTWHVPRTLEFILTAARNPDNPYLLVLEEMNLAHVEQYFADVLSGMESGFPVVPNLQKEPTGWRMPLHGVQYIAWPQNLFVIGTLNMDETTYTFSPKVLDRGTSLEFRVPPRSLKASSHAIAPVERGDQRLVDLFLSRRLGSDPEWAGREVLANHLQDLHNALYEHDAEFGHRVFSESLRFGALLADAGRDDPIAALDRVFAYKILPKFEYGAEYAEIAGLLGAFALHGHASATPVDVLDVSGATPALPVSFAKLRRMARLARRSS